MYHKCVVNPRLKCFPRLNDACCIGTEWLNIVTIWATTLEGHSFDISMTEGTMGDFRSQEDQMIYRTEIPRLLCNSDAMIEYCNSGYFTHDVCIDLIRSRFLWSRTRDGSTLKQAMSKFQTQYKGVLKDWMRSKAA